MLAVTQCLYKLHITAKVNSQRAPNPHVNLRINRTFDECLQNRRTLTDDASIEISGDGQPDNSMAETPVSNINVVENIIKQADCTQGMHYDSTRRQALETLVQSVGQLQRDTPSKHTLLRLSPGSP